MKNWIKQAAELLKSSLEPPCHELNELDWKITISPDKKRLAEHLSAYANQSGGGYLVFGIDASGTPLGISQDDVEKTMNQLASIGRDGVEPPIVIDYSIEDIDATRLLIVRIVEASTKPVHIRGKGIEQSFIRSGGTTRLASRQEIGSMMMNSRIPRWEELRASLLIEDSEFFQRLNVDPLFKMLERPIPTSQKEILEWMVGERFVLLEPRGGGYITNLGAISAARRLADFADLSRKAIRVIVYDGLNKSRTKQEQEGTKGYAVGFQGLLQAVMALLPQSEVIEEALRKKLSIYPEIALRELIANALIHQDFSITGVGPLIEVFDDRITISSPGGLLPSKKIDRIIGTQPESRNEQLARSFRRYKICEERGSGLIKAGLQVELFGLPPIEFESGTDFFKVTLYSPRTFAQMSARERLEACYQHAVLKHYSGSAMTNKSLRERLKMTEKQRSMVSVLIQEALDKGLIKSADPNSTSKKFAEYVPQWA